MDEQQDHPGDTSNPLYAAVPILLLDLLACPYLAVVMSFPWRGGFRHMSVNRSSVRSRTRQAIRPAIEAATSTGLVRLLVRLYSVAM